VNLALRKLIRMEGEGGQYIGRDYDQDGAIRLADEDALKPYLKGRSR